MSDETKVSRDYVAERQAYIKRVVDAMPPLTQVQRDRLFVLLRPAVLTDKSDELRRLHEGSSE